MPRERPAISRPELFDRLAQGLAARVTVLTPNARLAQVLQRDFDRSQQARGLAAWETADILPFGAFVARLWEDALYSELASRVPILLAPAQEQAAWDEAVRAAPVAAPVFSATAAAAQCREAWQLAHAWRLDARRAGPPNEDVSAWLDWSARYERALRERAQVDGARLPDVVSPWLGHAALRKPAAVALAGFDIVTPQMREFLDALSAVGCEPVPVAPPAAGGTVARIELTQSRDEIAAAARWARARLVSPVRTGAQSPRIGVVVPDLVRSRARVQRMFADAMRPGHGLDESPQPLPFNISLGAPLSDFPLAGDALRILALAGPEIAFESASRLIRSPFIGGAEAEIDVRARLDARLRDRAAPVVTLDTLLRLAAASQGARAPVLLDLLAGLSQARKQSLFGVKAASEWAKAFSEALRAVGFPGERPLDSAEHQALERWHALLAEFGTLERVTGRMGFVEACQRLAHMAREAIFQPEAPDVPVQVMGILESAGIEFDHLWVMGLTDEAWPLPARPNPFLPVALQRAAGIPQADSASSLELDRRITAGWLGAAPEVIFSHARMQDESELAPSPLIAAIAATPFETLHLPEATTLRSAIRRGGQVETIDDARAPAIASPEQRGGTGLFRDQAACPFRGFAHRRLGSRPLEAPRPGLDARDRGNLLHEMLAAVWRELESREGLVSRTRDELRAVLERGADQALASVGRKRRDALAGRFGALERARLVRLTGEWLEVEASRPDFEVLATEDKRPLTFGGVTVSAKLDRMDALAKGRAIIDYKTGNCATSAWMGERPEEPQVPMYAMAEGLDVRVVAFGQVKAGKMQFRGIGAEAGLVPNVKEITKDQSRAARQYRDWNALVESWRRELEAIGRGFAEGDARVDPKRGPLTCELCDQHTFCRIAEKAPFGVRKGDAEDE